VSEVPMFQPTERCRECQGKCCKALPGSWYPEDIPGGPSLENIVAFVASRKACFDWWEGDPRPGRDELSRGLFLRPRVVAREDAVQDPSWGGKCAYLTVTGCSLSWDERPSGCRAVEPGDKCVNHGGNKGADACRWLECGAMLEDALEVCTDTLCDKYWNQKPDEEETPCEPS